MIKLKNLILEKTTKRGFEAIKQITGGKPYDFGNMVDSTWLSHHDTGIVFGGKSRGSYKGGATGAQIFSQGGNKWKVEIIKGVPPKPRILKKIDNVSGNKLHSILKKHLGI